ncbi:MAG TPA: P-II family nitrogen regulator [Gammaproteobacteria bacterium]|nr:P-II family nitrogen regulator [Gammaproteobacteria bacterium]
MKLCKVTAIIREERSAAVERRLRQVGVPGVSCTQVRGYGEYADYYCDDLQVTHARFEIFVPQQQVQTIVEAVMEEARTGTSGDGIIAVLPVEHLYHVRDGTDLAAGD